MKKVWEWVKKQAVLLGLFLMGIVSLLLAVKYEKDKISRLQSQLQTKKEEAKLQKIKVEQAVTKGKEEAFAHDDTLLMEQVVADTKEIENAKRRKEYSSERIAAELNAWYGRRTEPND